MQRSAGSGRELPSTFWDLAWHLHRLLTRHPYNSALRNCFVALCQYAHPIRVIVVQGVHYGSGLC